MYMYLNYRKKQKIKKYQMYSARMALENILFGDLVQNCAFFAYSKASNWVLVCAWNFVVNDRVFVSKQRTI